MSFTRFHDDPARINKRLQESTDIGKYMLNVPGNGLDMPFNEDPYIRLQKWGANVHTNTVHLESDLFGLTRNFTRDCIKENDYQTHRAKTKPNSYNSIQHPTTEQPRATHPAWMTRDLEQNNWSYLHLNPQENVCMTFQNNLDTKLLERDYFVAKVPRAFIN
jgi:hypothetical protein